MTLEDLRKLSFSELLDLYAMLVRYDHYDPYVTPEEVQKLRNAGISQDDLESLLLKHVRVS